MLAIYLICGIVGGGLILAAALGGLTSSALDGIDTGGDADVDFDHSVDFDTADIDIDGDVDIDMTSDAGDGFDMAEHMESAKDFTQDAGFWLPFFSLRFWIYFAGGFGLFGTFLTLTKAAMEPIALWLALGFGALIGTAVAMVMRWLKGQESDSMIREKDMLGVSGKMVVTPRNGQPGKVRISVKGETLDLLALSRKGTEVERGEEVVVIHVDDSRVTVARSEDIFNSNDR